MKFNCTYILQFEMRFPCTISKSPSTYLDQQHSAFIIHNKRIAYMCCRHMCNGEKNCLKLNAYASGNVYISNVQNKSR